ncbi:MULTISPECIES: DsbA family protein [Tsukamurella]|uniref:Thioredoxin-like fold domain-containing protein n=2 Tax=Tsukamurella TaxID=2060 RepID=A0A5C5S480_9ACTN|nr:MULTISPECIES: thioredoxin domain-containing protein [Tsukamurella]NMD58465.1 thioredoxin domain-containing protein [Tsukamurella columbiensis]TWS30019.1 hypothetical protein FK530_05720 [Tsukamurella conjunctivitidis]
MGMQRVCALVVAVLVGVLALSGCARTVAGTAVADPAAGVSAASEDGAVVVGEGGRRITMFLEPMCPACRMLERQYGDQIREAVLAGRLTVAYRMLTFLDTESASGDYSTRATVAFHAASVGTSDAVTLEFLRALYDEQPRGATDLDNDGLASLAAAAGVPESVAERIRTGSTGVDGKAVGAANGALLTEVGGTGTPTVLADGRRVDLNDAAWLQKIVG